MESIFQTYVFFVWIVDKYKFCTFGHPPILFICSDILFVAMGADFKFIHCADLHLGSRFSGVSQKDPKLGKRMTESIFSSFDRIIDLAILEKADLMVISGDVFDEENETPATRYRFARALEKVKIQCYISLGNHDFKRSWEDSIPYPENVHIFSSSETEKQIININGNQIELIGRSFESRNTAENYASSFYGSYDKFTIGVLHCSVDTPREYGDYAPCRLSDLLNKNVDYWALGHIHKRSELNERPFVIYPGNIQGRNPKESGNKGAYVVSVSNGRVSETRFVPTQEILWQDIETDISGKDMQALISDISGKAKHDSILSIHITGKGDMDSVLRLGLDGVIDQISKVTGCVISSVELSTSPATDLSKISEMNDLRSKMVAVSNKMSGLGRNDLIDKICLTRASAEIRYIFESMSDEELRSMVQDAEMLLIEKLTEASR